MPWSIFAYDGESSTPVWQDSSTGELRTSATDPGIVSPANEYKIPRANEGFDNKDAYINSLIKQGATYPDGTKLTISDKMWGKTVILPKGANPAAIVQPYNANPKRDFMDAGVDFLAGPNGWMGVVGAAGAGLALALGGAGALGDLAAITEGEMTLGGAGAAGSAGYGAGLPAVSSGMTEAGWSMGTGGLGMDVAGAELAGLGGLTNGADYGTGGLEALGEGGGAAGPGTLGSETGAGWVNAAGTGTGTSALSTLNNLAKSPAGTSAIQKILSGSGGMQDWLSLLGPAMSIYSGVEGLDRADDYSNLVSGDIGGVLGQLNSLGITSPKFSPISSPGITSPTFTSPSLDPITGQSVDRSAQAKAAIAGADPWGASGGRSLADEQLQALMRSPGSLMTDPGYQAKMMGVDRVMAAQGQLGGGGGAVAAANASGDYYQQRLAALATLENMGNPVGAWQLGLGQEQLGLAEGQLNLKGKIANSEQAINLGQLGVSQAQTNLSGQVAASNQGIQLGQLDTQRGQLDLDAQKAMANLGVTKGQLGLDAAKLKLAAAGGANTLAGQSLASIGYGVTQATGGTTQMDQARQFLQALRASGATV